MKQPYQSSFYLSSAQVRDPHSRQEKAEKIMWALTRYAKLPPHAVCLDVGCASGIITSALSPLFRTTVGLDYDEFALRAADHIARQRVRFVRGDAMHLPFPEGAIDVVICAQVYEHVPDAQQLFNEIYRVLKPGGIVFFSGPNRLFPIEPHYFLPFLHWLPRPLANFYLQISGRGKQYYERSRDLWGLKKLMTRFSILDISIEVLQYIYLSKSRRWGKLLRCLPKVVWKFFLPFFPNFNWILYKPISSKE